MLIITSENEIGRFPKNSRKLRLLLSCLCDLISQIEKKTDWVLKYDETFWGDHGEWVFQKRPDGEQEGVRRPKRNGHVQVEDDQTITSN